MKERGGMPRESHEVANRRALSRHFSTIELDPCGSVIARVFLSANPSVYTSKHETIAHCGREKEMIQPHPFV
jgi:hypothetical protein